MTTERRERMLVLVDGLAIGAWAAFLIWAYVSGALEVLHPSFRWLSLMAGCVLVPMAGVTFLNRDASCSPACGTPHVHAGTTVALAARLGMRLALAAPIVLGVAVPMRGLSVDAVQRRGIQMLEIGSSDARPPVPAAEPAPVPQEPMVSAAPEPEIFYEELTFREVIERITGPEGEAAIEKLNLALIGQYLKDEECGEGQFKLYRIRITCCLADAEVMAVLVESKKPFTRKMAGEDGDSSEVNALVEESRVTGDRSGRSVVELLTDLGGWVRAMGRLKIYLDSGGSKRLKLIADKVERIAPPEKKYLFVGEDDSFY